MFLSYTHLAKSSQGAEQHSTRVSWCGKHPASVHKSQGSRKQVSAGREQMRLIAVLFELLSDMVNWQCFLYNVPGTIPYLCPIITVVSSLKIHHGLTVDSWSTDHHFEDIAELPVTDKRQVMLTDE